MDLRLITLAFVIVALLDSCDACKKPRRSKRNHATCRPNSMVRYRLTVHTLWSRTTFPKMFPIYRPHAQWSALIGRTHAPDYILWAEGYNASTGVKTFAETGDPSQLDIASTQGYMHVLDAFIAPPIQQSVGQTSTIIFLDGRHSRVSFIMKIVPSPDWFVGVSSVDLCANGRWKNRVHMDIQPMDSGTDRGLTFTSPNWPNEHPEPISTITSSFPDHPASSFYYPELEELPRIAYVDLEIVSEFSHRQKFMDVPQNESPYGSSRTTTTVTQTTHQSTTTATFSDSAERSLWNHPISLKSMPETSAFKEEKTLAKQLPNTEATWNEATAEVTSQESTSGRPATTQESAEEWTSKRDDTLTDAALITQMSVAVQGDKLLAGEIQNTAPEVPSQHADVTATKDENRESTTNTEVESSEQTLLPTKISVGAFDYIHYPKDQTKSVHNKQSEKEDVDEKIEKSKPSLRELLIGQQRKAQSSDSRKVDISRKVRPSTHYSQNDQDHKEVRPMMDCLVDEWSPWSTCTTSCGYGKRERTRDVLQVPQDGGANCPLLRELDICGSMRTCKWNHFSSFGNIHRERLVANRPQK
ncbi:Spondin-2 [Bulinus truncatus]|nr:Spondin-2 [Bulinus truncatus]